MRTIRKFLYTVLSLVLVGCSAIPADAPAASTQVIPPKPKEVETPISKPSVTKSGRLADSVPAVVWTGSQGHLLVPIDPASGQPLSAYEPIFLGQSYSYAFSPDRRTLAMVGFVSSEHPHGGSLHLIDLSAWQDQVYELRLSGYVTSMAFSPDGEQVGIAFGNNESQMLVFDLKKASITGQSSVDFQASNMKFTTDGSGLMVYGSKIENRYTVNEMSPDPPIVVLLDSTDLSTRWRADLAGVRHGIVPKDEKAEISTDLHQPGQAIYLFPGLAFAPERNILYVVHADEDKLTTVDFDAQEVGSMEIQPQLSWIERLLSLTAGVAQAKVAEGTTKHVTISPDGETLYIVGLDSKLGEEKGGEWQIIENPLGLQVVHAEDGSRIARYDTEASDISISYDGYYLYLRGWSQTHENAWTQIFDIVTNQPITRIENNTWLVPTRHLSGAPILASSVYINGEDQQHYTIVDPEDLSMLSKWSSTDYLVWLNMP